MTDRGWLRTLLKLAIAVAVGAGLLFFLWILPSQWTSTRPTWDDIGENETLVWNVSGNPETTLNFRTTLEYHADEYLRVEPGLPLAYFFKVPNPDPMRTSEAARRIMLYDWINLTINGEHAMTWWNTIPGTTYGFVSHSGALGSRENMQRYVPFREGENEIKFTVDAKLFGIPGQDGNGTITYGPIRVWRWHADADHDGVWDRYQVIPWVSSAKVAWLGAVVLAPLSFYLATLVERRLMAARAAR